MFILSFQTMNKSMLNYFFILAISIWTIETAQQPVENIPFYNHGLIFEELENVKIQFGEWIFQSTLNLQILKKEIHTIKILTEYINKTCSRLDLDFNIDCLQILKGVENNAGDFDSILSIINENCNEESANRSKRQINTLGHIFKDITGLMDNDDSKRLDNDLMKL